MEKTGNQLVRKSFWFNEQQLDRLYEIRIFYGVSSILMFCTNKTSIIYGLDLSIGSLTYRASCLEGERRKLIDDDISFLRDLIKGLQ